MMTTLLNSRYQIIEVLGVGGFGETFLAEDIYMPSRRRCVIKQLKPMTNDPQMYLVTQQRFQREATILEKLGEGSVQIPKLYAYFSENGQFYLVQEWIQGQTITSIVEAKGRLGETAVRDILASLLLVLDYVHTQGIIHRDIKPDNIILRHENALPILIDFGAVKETIATLGYNGGIKPSIVLGTPGFMSPEQAAGRPSYSSDLYSLGLTAIYMLTGKLPHELEIEPQTGQILWQQYALNVSSSLVAFLDRAVQSHPRDRYSTAKKMLLDLQDNGSIPSTEPSTATTITLSPNKLKVSSQPATVKSPQITPAINYPSSQRNWLKKLIFGSLLAGGLLGTLALVGLVRNQPSPSTTEEPIATTRESPAPTSEPVNVLPTPVIDSPAPTISASQPKTEQKNSQTPLPQARETPSVTQQDNSQTPLPQARETPSVTQQQNSQASTPSVSETPPENKNQNKSNDNAVSNSVPGFPIGTSESRVKAVLGNPTQISRGIWANTRAYIYEIKPNQITLGYLFDRNSGQLRQTEVSFAQSVAFEQMQATLQEMLGHDLINVNQGLQRVYQRRVNNYTFNTGELKVAILRNERDRIYIGVWDASLH